MTIKELYENVAKDVLQQVNVPETPSKVEVLGEHIDQLMIAVIRNDKKLSGKLLMLLHQRVDRYDFLSPLPEQGFGSKETMV